ncbi:MAG: beta-N-acetylhexosaminidase [Bacteroidales bacterium]|nr:beta-N-acetylhexosaminidase [Bacteroidales bacterium]
MSVESEKTITVPHNVSFYVLRPQLESLIPAWLEMYEPVAGVKMARTTDKANVLLDFDPTMGPGEYRLGVEKDPDKIIVAGGDVAGVWWGMQSMAQILLQCAYFEGFELPVMEVRDKPAFAYRGGMLDCCRHFFTVDNVKQFIDILAMHKLNTFHWHLTDDQGWRIEIKKYPLLTEVGSVRSETVIGRVGQRDDFEYDGIPHGGFYTQDEIRDIVQYAADRQITVIPEIEMPGHALAALASYPQLGCRGEGYEVSRMWGIFPDIFCAGNPEVLEFLKGVLDEVCELFPSEYIHIGGDEAPTERWEECPKCQAKKQELGLDNVAYLHGYLLKEIEEYLNEKGRKIIGWDEVLDAGVTPTATVMSWRGAIGGKRAAAQGNDVIMTPNTYFYFDYYQTDDPKANGEPLGIGGHLPLSQVYSFDPYEELDADAQTHIKGIQANLWAEYIAEFDHVQKMILPRYCALSEDAWGSEKEDYDSFRERVKEVMVPLYETLGLTYAEYGFE